MNEIIQGDCLEVMKGMADGSVDCLVTDMPYGLDIKYRSYEDTRENLTNLVEKFMPEALRVSNRIVLFPGIHNVWLYPPADWICCWFYGTTGSWGKYGYNAWQPILVYGKNKRRYGMDTIKFSKMEKRFPGHPCSKPLGLMMAVVERFTEPGELILDPFLGSGTTTCAAKMLGRKYIGIELDAEYVKIAKARVAAVPDPLI